MRFLALETDIEKMKEHFVVEGEDVLLTTAHHRFIFLIPLVLWTIVTVVIAALAILFAVTYQSEATTVIAGIVFLLWALYYAYRLLQAFVQWRYNFIVVTTRKVVIVDHILCFYENVTPIHLENISSTVFDLQFLGIDQCGTLHFHLKERVGGSTMLIDRPYISNPEAVAGIIENAIGLLSQKKEEGQKLGEQQTQIDAVKDRALGQVPDGKTV